MEKRGYTHSKFILGVHSTPAHRPGVMKLMHVVGFVKAERQEIAEAPGTRPVLVGSGRVVSTAVPIRLSIAGDWKAETPLASGIQ